MEAVVLHRVGFSAYFCPKQGQDFKPSAAPLYPNLGQVPPPPPGATMHSHWLIAVFRWEDVNTVVTFLDSRVFKSYFIKAIEHFFCVYREFSKVMQTETWSNSPSPSLRTQTYFRRRNQWQPEIRLRSQAIPTLLVEKMLRFLFFFGVVWKENIWRVFRVKLPFSNSSAQLSVNVASHADVLRLVTRVLRKVTRDKPKSVCLGG